MKAKLRQALAAALLCLADDELILGHRDSEWCGYAPILEEDIAFANIALDEIGHAALWYREIAELTGRDPDAFPDQLVYSRTADEFCCVQLVEYPRGDWAYSMLRQYLFDSAELLRLQQLTTSQYQPVALVAQKITREEIYHLRHTQAWITRLGLGTIESHQRLQTALDELWAPAQQLFMPLPGEKSLVEAGLLPDSLVLLTAWREQVQKQLQQINLHIPTVEQYPDDRSEHTPHLEVLLRELQSVARSDPLAEW